MLVFRLQRRGKKNQPFFWIVIAEKTAPIKGKFIEKIGFLNPIKKQKNINKERAKYWLLKGAKPSDSVYNLFIDERLIKDKKRKIKISKKKEKKVKKEKAKIEKEPMEEPMEESEEEIKEEIKEDKKQDLKEKNKENKD